MNPLDVFVGDAGVELGNITLGTHSRRIWCPTRAYFSCWIGCGVVPGSTGSLASKAGPRELLFIIADIAKTIAGINDYLVAQMEGNCVTTQYKCYEQLEGQI